MLKEFKEFAMRGNVLDLAIGIIIGAAFGAIITSFVNDILLPPIGLLLGGLQFDNMFWTIKGESYPTLALAQENGAVTINYGLFISAVIDFLIIALAIFLVVRLINRMRREPEVVPADPTTRECPYCATAISIKATRCPNCTSQL